VKKSQYRLVINDCDRGSTEDETKPDREPLTAAGRNWKLPPIPLRRDRHRGASRQGNLISYCAP